MDVDRGLSQPRGTDKTSGPVGAGELTVGAGRLLMVSPGAPCEIRLAPVHRRAHGTCSSAIGAESAVIASTPRLMVSFTTHRNHEVVDEGDVCCILAFVDTALNPVRASQSAAAEICLQAVPVEAISSTAQLGHWLTLQVMQGHADNELLHHLRRQESYALATYLLKSPLNGAHLNELCVTYGLSYTHFRRLCRRSLGGAIKARLRAWRAARTLLNIIDSDQSILEIAVDNGYTSASHVSTDIKQLFGFTPRTARNARNLLP
ncbi:MAG: helix-turn-helix domain-containing protein [Alcaligenaceae bacterium]|nr:MAG: helix-turn-helix domain-containing protein [Alcaligenaceae bacterium]